MLHHFRIHLIFLDELGAIQRDDSHRDDVRSEQRKNHGRGESHEKEAADAVEKNHRKKNDGGGDGGGKHG